MFRWFRRHLEAQECASAALADVSAALKKAIDSRIEGSDLDERVASLELQRAVFEADMEGLLSKAEGKLKAASNSEARERTMRKQREAFVDDFDEVSQAPQPQAQYNILPDGNGEIGYPEGVQPMPMGVATDNKAHITRMKFMT